MLIHVSIHDVSPVFAAQVERALSACQSHGATAALLVVPNYHGKALLTEHPEFCARLGQLSRQGHPIYLHGLLHQAASLEENAPDAGTLDRLRWHYAQRIVSAGEAEYSELERSVAADRLDEGARVLRAAGLEPEGFVAPAWSMPSLMLSLLAARGYRHTEDHWWIYDPVGGRRRSTLLLNWATRSAARLWSTVAYCRASRAAGRLLPTRIAIHPRDVEHPVVLREIESLLRWGQGHFVTASADLWQDAR